MKIKSEKEKRRQERIAESERKGEQGIQSSVNSNPSHLMFNSWMFNI